MRQENKNCRSILFFLGGLGILFLGGFFLVGGSSEEEVTKGRGESIAVQKVEGEVTREIQSISVVKNTENIRKINGLWKITRIRVIETRAGETGEATPSVEENQFYLQLCGDSSVWMTQLTEDEEGQEEYLVSSISEGNITVFRRFSPETLKVYHLELLERDFVKGEESKTASVKKQPSSVRFELLELYDQKTRKIISVENSGYSIEGSMVLEKGKVSHLFVRMNDLEINPAVFNSVGRGDYDYAVEKNSALGKAQGAFISDSEFNLYFISGEYRGYTLIFSKALSDDERYEKMNNELEQKHEELSRTGVINIAAENLINATPEQARDLEQVALLERTGK